MKNVIITIITIFIVVFLSCLAFAQSAGSKTENPEEEVIQDAAITEEPEVRDDIDKFLEKRGWLEGENAKSDGTPFFIAIGVSTIKAPREHRAYISSRIIAFESAILLAKKQMVEYMRTKIEVEASKDYIEGDFDAAQKRASAAAEANKVPGIMDKSKMLIHAYLDKKIKEEGVEPDSKKGKEKIKKILLSESFKKVSRNLAQARILGMQVFKTFEASPEGDDQGEVGVVCIQSDKLRRMAEAMVPGSGVALPKQASKKPIIQQIPTDKRVLLSSYGVQQKINENGNLVLVAFAQAQPVTKSKTSRNAASRKAKLSAMGLIRQFAGENAHVATAHKIAETYKEFEDGAPDYQNDEAYREQLKTYSKEMNISGISTIKRWRYKHPLTGATVVGVVCIWSPKSALKAKSLKKKMEAAATPKKKVQGVTASPTTKIGEGQKGKYKGEGKEGDKDAF